MSENIILREALFEAIQNQIDADDPPETAKTLKRLLAEGFSEEDSMKYIGQALAVELWDAMHNKRTFNLNRYTRNLQQLPAEPKE